MACRADWVRAQEIGDAHDDHTAAGQTDSSQYGSQGRTQAQPQPSNPPTLKPANVQTCNPPNLLVVSHAPQGTDPKPPRSYLPTFKPATRMAVPERPEEAWVREGNSRCGSEMSFRSEKSAGQKSACVRVERTSPPTQASSTLYPRWPALGAAAVDVPVTGDRSRWRTALQGPCRSTSQVSGRIVPIAESLRRCLAMRNPNVNAVFADGSGASPVTWDLPSTSRSGRECATAPSAFVLPLTAMGIPVGRRNPGQLVAESHSASSEQCLQGLRERDCPGRSLLRHQLRRPRRASRP